MRGNGITGAQGTGFGGRVAVLAAAVTALTAALIGGSITVALDAGSAPMPFGAAADDDPFLSTPGELDVEEISVTRSVMARRPAQPAFVFTVRNDSTVASVEITRMSDATLGELDGLGNCELPQTLAASQLYTCHVNIPGVGSNMPFAGVTVLAEADSGAWLAAWARTPQSQSAIGRSNPADSSVLGTSTDAPLRSDREVLLID